MRAFESPFDFLVWEVTGQDSGSVSAVVFNSFFPTFNQLAHFVHLFMVFFADHRSARIRLIQQVDKFRHQIGALQLDQSIGRAAGHPRPLIHLPLQLVRAVARGFDLLGPAAPITSDQLQMLVEGSATPKNAAEPVFGIRPVPFEEGLRRFL